MITQGIGGVFLYASDPEALAAWYSRAFGLQLQNWGESHGIEFPSADREPGGRLASTTFAIFPAKGESSGRRVMLNWRVDDLEAAMARLQAAGAVFPGEVAADDYGRFARTEDPEGNGVELWEPPQAS